MSDDAIWFVNIDAAKKKDPNWMQYKDEDAIKIEKFFVKHQKSKGKLKPISISDYHNIDIVLMRQVRKDDADRWRAIKRGGTAKDPPPMRAASPDDEEEDAADNDDGDEDMKDAAPAAVAAPVQTPMLAPRPPAAAASPAPPAPVAAPVIVAPVAKKAAFVKNARAQSKPAAAAVDAPAPASSSSSSSSSDHAMPSSSSPPPYSSSSSSSAYPASSSSSSCASCASSSSMISSLRAQLDDSESDISAAADRQRVAIDELNASFARERDDFADERKKLNDQISAASNDAKKLKSDIVTMTKSRDDAIKANDVASKNSSIASLASSREVAQLKADNAAAKAETQPLRSEVDRLKSEMTKLRADTAPMRTEVGQLKASNVQLKIDIADRTRDCATANASASSSHARLASTSRLFTSLADAIQPLIAMFGLVPTTPVGSAMQQYQRWKNDDADVGASSASSSSAPSAPAAEPSRKRARVEDDVKQHVAPVISPPSSPAPSSDDDDMGIAAPAATSAPCSPCDPTIAPSDAPLSPRSDADVDEDGASEAGGGYEATQAMDFHSDAASSSSVVPFLSAESYSSTPLTPTPASRNRVPLCFASLPLTAASTAHVQMILVGYRAGMFDLFEVNSQTGLNKLVPLSPRVNGRPQHKFASEVIEGEDAYSPKNNIHAMAAVAIPGKQANAHFLLCLGEGRLFRTYTLDLSVTPAALSFVNEYDVKVNSHITAISVLKAPSSAASSSAPRIFVGVGVSGANHVVQIYASGDISANKRVELKCVSEHPVHSDEVRGIDQLPSNGSILVAGCSTPQVGGKMNEEGGSIEIIKWDTPSQRKAGDHLLRHDNKIHASIGLRCNGIRVYTDGGVDHLLAAYEYCSNGARHLIRYDFDRSGVDVSATNIESKNQPSADENTFTQVDVTDDHKSAIAMTYGGKLIVYDMSQKSRSFTINCHADSETDDASKFIISSTNGNGDSVLLTMGGPDNGVNVWTPQDD